jgi:hypothetical protein
MGYRHPSTAMASEVVDIDVVVLGEIKISFSSFSRFAYSPMAGPAGSGKTSLTARLVRTYSIYSLTEMGILIYILSLSTSAYTGGPLISNRSFRFILSERDGSSSDLQFALVTLNLTQADGSLYSDVVTLARRISKAARQPGTVCILVTKVDSFAQDPSKVEYYTIPTRCTFAEILQCHGVSAFDGTGISEVLTFIGTLFLDNSLRSNGSNIICS